MLMLFIVQTKVLNMTLDHQKLAANIGTSHKQIFQGLETNI